MRYVFVIIPLFILGCKPHDKNKGVAFAKVEEAAFEASGFVSTNPSLIQLVESDSGDFTFVYNHIANNFQFIEFPTGKLAHEVPLHFEGPNNVKGFGGGTLTGPDSIWIASAPYGIGLINFNGEVLPKKTLKTICLRLLLWKLIHWF